MDQLQLFETPTVTQVTPVSAPLELVERPFDAVLVTTTRGLRGYHRVRTVGQNGFLLTCCGLYGRGVEDTTSPIPLCPACAAS
jgi:hypothetical protein